MTLAKTPAAILASDHLTRMGVVESLLLAVVLTGSGLLISWIGYRAERGTLRRNWVAGIRTRASLESDAAWDACHRAGGRLMTLAGLVSLAFAVPLLFRPPNLVGLGVVLVGMAAMMALVIWSAVKGDRAARGALAEE